MPITALDSLPYSLPRTIILAGSEDGQPWETAYGHGVQFKLFYSLNNLQLI